MEALKKCCVCGKSEEKVGIIRARVDDVENDYCTTCIGKQGDKRIAAIGYETDLGFGTGAPSTDTSFYFKVNPEYFANADKFIATYSHEKPMDEKWFEQYTRVNLVAQALGIPVTNGNLDTVLDLLSNDEARACDVYNSIISITKEEYKAM